MEITQSTEPVTSAHMISLRTALEQLQLKKVTLEEIDTKIINAMEDMTALEEEIYEAEEYKTMLTEKISFLQNFISSSVTTLLPPPASPPASDSDTRTITESRTSPQESVALTT